MRWYVAFLIAVVSGVVPAYGLASAEPAATTEAAADAAARARNPLEGTWKVIQIDVFSDRGERSYPDPAPGLVMFGKRYYSMVWMPLTEVPEDFAEIWRPTTEEMASAFGSIIVNAGTYTLTDSTLTTLPLVAKTPEFIGGRATYDYSVSGDTLRLDMTDAVSHNDVRDPGVGRVRLPLTLIRVE